MRDRVSDLISQRPEMQFSRQSAASSVMSLFGDKSQFAIGMGAGNKIGERPAFMNATKRFGESRFMRHRMGG